MGKASQCGPAWRWETVLGSNCRILVYALCTDHAKHCALPHHPHSWFGPEGTNLPSVMVWCFSPWQGGESLVGRDHNIRRCDDQDHLMWQCLATPWKMYFPSQPSPAITSIARCWMLRVGMKTPCKIMWWALLISWLPNPNAFSHDPVMPYKYAINSFRNRFQDVKSGWSFWKMNLFLKYLHQFVNSHMITVPTDSISLLTPFVTTLDCSSWPEMMQCYSLQLSEREL